MGTHVLVCSRLAFVITSTLGSCVACRSDLAPRCAGLCYIVASAALSDVDLVVLSSYVSSELRVI